MKISKQRPELILLHVTQWQVTAVYTGDSTRAVAREQLCGQVSPATREHAIMEETFSVQSRLGSYNEG
jgi:hypothetical protein